jgi:hypothetical protein
LAISIGAMSHVSAQPIFRALACSIFSHGLLGAAQVQSVAPGQASAAEVLYATAVVEECGAGDDPNRGAIRRKYAAMLCSCRMPSSLKRGPKKPI